MEEIWEELRNMKDSAILDTDDYEAVIYQGLKVVREGDEYLFLSTENDFYPKVADWIVDVFFEHGVEAGIKAYKMDKYKRQLAEFGSSTKIALGLTRKIEAL